MRNQVTTGYCSLLIRVLKIRMNFWTTGLVQWSTLSDNQNHQTSRSILVDGLVHPHTMKLFYNFLATSCQHSGNFLFTGLFEVGQADHTYNKVLYFREGEGWQFCVNNKFAFSHYKFKNLCFPGKNSTQPSLGVIGNIRFPSIRDKEELIIPPFTATSSPRFRQ